MMKVIDFERAKVILFSSKAGKTYLVHFASTPNSVGAYTEVTSKVAGRELLLITRRVTGDGYKLTPTVATIGLARLHRAAKRGWLGRLLLGGPYTVLYNRLRWDLPETQDMQALAARLCRNTLTVLDIT